MPVETYSEKQKEQIGHCFKKIAQYQISLNWVAKKLNEELDFLNVLINNTKKESETSD